MRLRIAIVAMILVALGYAGYRFFPRSEVSVDAQREARVGELEKNIKGLESKNRDLQVSLKEAKSRAARAEMAAGEWERKLREEISRREKIERVRTGGDAVAALIKMGWAK